MQARGIKKTKWIMEQGRLQSCGEAKRVATSFMKQRDGLRKMKCNFLVGEERERTNSLYKPTKCLLTIVHNK